MADNLLVERPRPGILRITINDPARRNPLSTALFRAIESELRGAATDTRLVLLTGAGDEVFASGADLSELGQEDARGLGGGFGSAMEAAQAAIEECRVPVVARIQGHCLGAGYQLVLACDLRVAADTARLGVPASRFGLLPGPVHHLRMLQQLGPQTTRLLMLTGRTFTGAEALRLGLADVVAPAAELDAVVDALCDEILDGAPITVRNSKRMINSLLKTQEETLQEDGDLWRGLEGLAEQAHASEDVREGLTAFFERRPANFKGR
ncbi:MAG: enoyl-CoA hydratase-related protein [Candidatus Dormibacteraeota bacterium]|nr:enoyl-CoA hydratase-related protein [Candidatus Dormibacteraeota bacterium]